MATLPPFFDAPGWKEVYSSNWVHAVTLIFMGFALFIALWVTGFPATPDAGLEGMFGITMYVVSALVVLVGIVNLTDYLWRLDLYLQDGTYRYWYVLPIRHGSYLYHGLTIYLVHARRFSGKYDVFLLADKDGRLYRRDL